VACATGRRVSWERGAGRAGVPVKGGGALLLMGGEGGTLGAGGAGGAEGEGEEKVGIKPSSEYTAAAATLARQCISTAV